MTFNVFLILMILFITGYHHIGVLNTFPLFNLIFLVYTYVIWTILVATFICVYWIRLRNFFPLKERSPKTLILFCISNTIYILAFPITYLCKSYGFNATESLVYIFFFVRILAFWPYIIRYIKSDQ